MRIWAVAGSARLRILGWQLLLVALALAGSVLASREVLLARVDERVDQGLARQVAELRRFANTPIDPSTARPFPDVRALLRAHLERSIPDRNQTMLALVDGAPVFRGPETPPYRRLDTDPAAIHAFVSSVASGQPSYGDVRTPAGEVRYVAAPVRVPGRPEQGIFVSAVFVDRERAEVDEVARVLGVVGFGALAVAGVAGWLVAGRVLAPVRMVRRAAQSITETDLSRRIPIGRRARSRGGRGAARDEISELARTFNGMLDRLEEAFATQRAFVDDAGHELRTPITIIRGHLELLGDDPDERAETTALVLDELDRMSRMVDDLLTLAKAERPDFLRREPVEVAAFTADLFVKARALAPRDWRLDGVGQGRVLADRQRLTQAMAQLAQNATQHTRAGDPITIGSAVTGRAARFWVTDSGPGVAPADRARIFERFARGALPRPAGTASARRSLPRHSRIGSPGSGDDPGRAEPAGTAGNAGAGLGLAIVRAIAAAHGGTVQVTGEPGEGATFTLELALLDHGARDSRPREPAGGATRPDDAEPDAGPGVPRAGPADRDDGRRP
ncbi:HAMP domain-containing protein [Frankia sp. CNm7]|uniref:histidine kinase n=1 Tax=Frankia nepalensis TaxID=1836974 RepID=A0A937RKL9_9ACTN|nr:ATP-binding protein [Frankia nepalensis]MBL7495486.1 HAMP domain-containing protein [Frankia nepalensis]MBL7510854.1 HAMP domain-containing protein [Frankia nepalensis]MBL7522319.1 HAMP domain-containing protein [Frankia nepalensis]MBL7630589.1 HAMP domain-containing protein [Frankia nepalensis]